MRLRGHLALWLSTALLLLFTAELPEWFLWSPLALWTASLVLSAVRLPRIVAPLLGAAGVAGMALAHVSWLWISFGLSLTVGSVCLGAAARIRFRPGASVLLASVPLAAWVVGFFLGPQHAALEAHLRELLLGQMTQLVPYDARMGMTAGMFHEWLARVVDFGVLLLPAFCVVQAPILMAWGYGLSQAALESSVAPLPALPRFSRFRMPDGAVWLLCAGLFLLVTRQAPVLRAGANVSAVMAVAYFCQGVSVLTFMALALRATWLIVLSLVVIWALLLSPLFSLFTCILGLSDVWLDFRRLQAASDEKER